MFELQPDPEMKANKITYTYDQYDRVYLKNYYLGTVPRARYGRYKSSSPIPKKLLYQDIYRYRSNTANEPYFIDRIYQPIISIPVLSRNGNDVTAIASVVCKSPIVQSGFIYNTDVNALAVATMYPGIGFWRGGINANIGNNGIGQINLLFTDPATVYVKAYCTMETGVLFSKAVSI
jgi:hypothetical protein